MMEKDFFEHEGHRNRLRYRIMNDETDNLPAHELMEYILYHSIARQNVNELSHRILEYFGSIQQMLKGTPEDFDHIEGIGDNTKELLILLTKCADAYHKLEHISRRYLKNYADTFELAKGLSRIYTQPCCIQICLNHKNQIVYRRSAGSFPDWASAMDQCFSDAISRNIKSVILFMFTGGRSVPTEYDLEHADIYSRSLKINNCSLLDVMIVGDDITSMRRHNQIPDYDFSSASCDIRRKYMLTKDEIEKEESLQRQSLHYITEVEL